MNNIVRVKVPASTANLGPGFDSLGMALTLYSYIEMQQAEETCIALHGENLDGIPTDKSNLIYKVAQSVFEEAGVDIPELSISMYSEVPLTRGLGSSASAIIGALVAANELIGSPLTKDRLFTLATQIEKHPDNVGASLFGGFVATAWDGNNAHYVKIDPPKELEILVVIPHFQLSTTKAREALPKSLSLQDAVYNISRSSLLVGAVAAGRYDLLAAAMRDRLHQPYRAELVPGMAEILEQAPLRGALGASLSGAGPTVLALVHREETRKHELENYMLQTMNSHGLEADTLWLQPDHNGVQIMTKKHTDSFLDMVKGEVKA
ncbi:homoserine kinase [Paenibacillus gallinarum]|uniref:Homoserine kinase n=1 Tax=Paenibacillus gallinarum TaxID=2762232 RepID=A0ABR8T240_9BACL|nr:homoserine kinase [Paenibacillus gallinarum]MBD7969832.1 homoserine kinase [Paenibacillus gallinarum]